MSNYICDSCSCYDLEHDLCLCEPDDLDTRFIQGCDTDIEYNECLGIYEIKKDILKGVNYDLQ